MNWNSPGDRGNDDDLGVRLTQMFEKVFEVGIVDSRDARRAVCRRYRHVPVLLLERGQYVPNLCNDLLHSGIRFLQIIEVVHNLFVIHI